MWLKHYGTIFDVNKLTINKLNKIRFRLDY